MENHEFKFIDLRIDWAFKYVYGSRGNEDLLLNLIDAILPEKHISKVELREQEQIPDSRKQRRSVFDVNCTTQSGESLIIEMQNAERRVLAGIHCESCTILNTALQIQFQVHFLLSVIRRLLSEGKIALQQLKEIIKEKEAGLL